MANRKVKEILKGIDFEAIHDYMEKNGRGWASGTSGFEIPSVKRIREFVEEHTSEIMNRDEDVIMTCGGFWFIRKGKAVTVIYALGASCNWH